MPATFQLRIYSNTGTSAEEEIDITGSDQYNDFKNSFKSLELEKITCQFRNDNVPADMFFEGKIRCTNENMTEIISTMDVPRMNISEAAGLSAQGSEIILNGSREDLEKISSRLALPEKLGLNYTYLLTDTSSNPYNISPSVAGSNFQMIIRLYIRVDI